MESLEQAAHRPEEYLVECGRGRFAIDQNGIRPGAAGEFWRGENRAARRQELVERRQCRRHVDHFVNQFRGHDRTRLLRSEILPQQALVNMAHRCPASLRLECARANGMHFIRIFLLFICLGKKSSEIKNRIEHDGITRQQIGGILLLCNDLANGTILLMINALVNFYNTYIIKRIRKKCTGQLSDISQRHYCATNINISHFTKISTQIVFVVYSSTCF